MNLGPPIAQGHAVCLLLQQLGDCEALSRSLRMFALFLSKLGQSRISLAPLCCPLGQAMKGTRVKTVQGLNSIPGLVSPTPQTCTCSPWQLPLGDQDNGGWGEGRGWNQKIWFKTCFAQWGTYTRVGSETCVKEPFKGLLSARTQHCVLDRQVQATPLCKMGRDTGPPPQKGTRFTSL